MFDMFGKLQEMQQQMEATKKRLDTMTVIGDAEGVTVTANGNRANVLKLLWSYEK